MNKRFLLSLGIVLALLLSLVGPTAAAAQSPQTVKVLIGFDRQPGPNEEGIVRGAGGTIKYTYHLVPAIAASVPETAIQGLSRNPRVVSIEPDIKVYAIDAELDNTWGVKRIGAGVVHDGGNKGATVKVAVIDSGIDYTHTDLDANYAGGYDFVNGDSNPIDDNGHGTHVAGTIAAEDNDIGVVGVAPEARISGLKVLGAAGSGSYSDVIAALEWTVDNGIQVTNNSYGSSGDPGATVKAAFDNAYAAGVIHIAAAGNSGNPPGNGDNVIYPARWDSVIAVAATDESDSRARWSSTGPDLELAAPGVSISSALLGGSYGEKSGTSMASPHVAGTAALVIATGISDTNGNGWVNDEVRQKLLETADDLGDPGLDTKYGYGLVDAEEAAAIASVGNPPTVPWVNPTDGAIVSGTVILQIDASDTEDATGMLTVEWRLDGGIWQTAAYNIDTSYYEDSWDSTGVGDGDHTLDARATDSDGNTAGASVTVTTENTDDSPVTSWVNPKDGDTVKDTVLIQIDAADDRDADGTLAVEWRVDGGDWQAAAYNSGSGYYEASWDTTAVGDGDHTLDARTTDSGANASSLATITVTVNNTGGSSVEMYVWEMTWAEKHFGRGSSFTDLSVTVDVNQDSDADGVAESGDDPASNAAVTLVLTHDTDGDGIFEPGTDDDSWNFQADTGSEGQVTFTLKFAPAGDYQAEVTGLTHDTLTWNSGLDADNPDWYYGVPYGNE